MGALTLEKVKTGIRGLDDITGGGLPRGRPTLLCGGPGCGKTLLAMQFLVKGAVEQGEPGIFMAFEETAEELARNVSSLGFDLPDLIARKKLEVDYVRVERSEIEVTGDYDLEGLFIRLGHAIDSIGARRVVLDTIESLFSAFQGEAVLRAELRRLFRFLKEKKVTAVVTGERGEGQLTRRGLEEYVSDCVIVLDHRVSAELTTRRLRVVKYRGSSHGTNEYPFLIDEQGIAVLPITSVGLDYAVSSERISTGIPRLDSMLGGQGVHRGSSVLISGTAGTGKTSLAAHMAEAACRRNQRCLYFAFEESPAQIMRNMRSIGIELEPWVKAGLLRFVAVRSTLFGLEAHLTSMHSKVEELDPALVIVDPISNLGTQESRGEVKNMMMRFIDFLKGKGITGLMTSLTHGEELEGTVIDVSSLMDTWLLLRVLEGNGERNRGLYVLKSRGTAHSNQIREFQLSQDGVQLTDVYVGPGGVATGTARMVQEAREQAVREGRSQELGRKGRELERRRQALEARVEALRAEFRAETEELSRAIEEDRARGATDLREQQQMGRVRGAGENGNPRVE